jgi:hypothetical protein
MSARRVPAKALPARTLPTLAALGVLAAQVAAQAAPPSAASQPAQVPASIRLSPMLRAAPAASAPTASAPAATPTAAQAPAAQAPAAQASAAPSAAAAAPAQAAAAAPDDAHREAAELFVATGGETLMQRMLDSLHGQLAAILVQHGKSQADATAIVDEVLMPEFKAHVPELRPAMIEIWADNLSVDEMRTVRAFYDTPTGRKLLEKQPLIFQQAAAIGAAWGQRVARDALHDHADELKRRGVTL